MPYLVLFFSLFSFLSADSIEILSGLNIPEGVDTTTSETFLAPNQLKCVLTTSDKTIAITRSANLQSCPPKIELMNNDIVHIPSNATANVFMPHLNQSHQLLSGNNHIKIDIIKYAKLKSGGNIKLPNAIAFVGNAKRKNKTFIVSEKKYSYFNNTRPRDPNFKLH